MWVMAGDSAGTRYFIPDKGVDTGMLTAEAMSMMTPEKREAVRRGSNGGAEDVLQAGLIGFGNVLVEVDQQTGGQLFCQQPRR